jgi:hypothetical protein
MKTPSDPERRKFTLSGALDWAMPAEFARRCLGSQALAITKESENSISEQR